MDSNAWTETGVTWRNRPSTTKSLVPVNPTAISAGHAMLDARTAFPTGFVDRSTLTLAVRNASPNATTFGSRESSARAQLHLTVGTTPVNAGELAPAVRTPGPTRPIPARLTRCPPLCQSMARHNGNPFLLFDTSSIQGPYTSLVLKLSVSDGGGQLRVYRIGTSWTNRS